MNVHPISRLGASPGSAAAMQPWLAPKRLITIYTQKLANLDELKQSLLQNAFTGRHDESVGSQAVTRETQMRAKHSDR